MTNLETLHDRRTELTMNFATRSLKNPRYTDGWFPKKPQKHYSTRNNRPLLEVLPRTERMKKDPITYMRKLLNDQFNKNVSIRN